MARNSDELVAQYAEIHRTRSYGATSIKNLRFLRPEVRLLRPRSILDYGCGQSRLLEALAPDGSARLLRYDPAIPEFSEPPREVVDLLVNVDVLEHIPETDTDATLAHMASLCRNAIIVIDTKPAALILPTGENAHCTLHPHAWWEARLRRIFPDVTPIRVARRSRAAFRTWRHGPADAVRFRALRAAEDLRHFGGRALRLVGGAPESR
jgi:hypothetical protein